ncbi:hypothetical protein C3L33_18481, partial [Rhododendron williamsianum]
MVAGCETTAVLVVREFDGKKNCKGVEEVERRCEVGSGGKLSLFTDLLGDPICRVRHSPAYLMLVAEAVKVGEGDKEEREILGMIRGCIKSVTCGKKFSRSSSVPYPLNPGPTRFRPPGPGQRRIAILKLAPSEAESLYRRRFSTTEFFPRDIDSVLNNKLNLGTFIAFPKGTCFPGSWPGAWRVAREERVGEDNPVGGPGLPLATRPVGPEVFRPFGLHFLYGLGGEGPMAVKYVKALCGFAHNLAMESGCGVVATEV